MSSHPQANAFLRAAYEGKLDCVLEMLDNGIPIDASNQAGLQALHFAAKTNNVELADELLRRGTEVNAATLKGNTALHVAALMAHTEIIKLLLCHGAAVNHQSDCLGDTFTPLYMAAQVGNQEIVTLLLAHGADPTFHTKNGSTPRDVARQQGFQPVAELLREYERQTRRIKHSEAQGLPKDESDGSESSESYGDNSSEASPQHRKLGPPPNVACLDVCASPKNSPKRFPRKPETISDEDQT